MKIENGSEQAVLGRCLAEPGDIAELLRLLEPHMFAQPGNGSLAALMRSMDAEAIPVDASTVLSRVMQREELVRMLGDQPGPYLNQLQFLAAAHTLEAARWHAGLVRTAYAESMLAERLSGAGESLAAGRTDVPGAVLAAAQALDEAEELAAGVGGARVRTATDLLATDPPIDWLIPGLLARRERVMLTGGEGLGKSELLVMLGVCAAAGVQPWTGEQHEPLRVLHLDLENDRDQLRRRYRRIITAMERNAELDRDRLMVETMEAGIDLTRSDDIVRLHRLLAAAAPHILIIGPLYKMHRANINDEQAARGLVHTLDEVRVRHDVAILTEAHPGLSQGDDGARAMRPRGSSLFLGWPNVGFGLRKNADAGNEFPPRQLDLVPWRGNREARDWPDGLLRARSSREWPALPFLPYWAPGNSPSDRAEREQVERDVEAARRAFGGGS